MEMTVNRSIIQSSREKTGMMVGIAVIDGQAQIRQVDARGMTVREGRLVLFMKDDKGNEVIVQLSPDEGAAIGPTITHLAWLTMGAPPPAIEVKQPPKLEIAQ